MSSISGQSTPVPYEPRTRKGHRKVRTGCGTCKRRKIKCDEGRPSCINCAKYGVECGFTDQRLPRRGSAASPPTPAAATPVSTPSTAQTAHPPDPGPGPGPGQLVSAAPTPGTSSYQPSPSTSGDQPLPLNATHLELLHNYVTLTSHTLSGDPIMRNVWRINVPQVGFRYEYVMRSILALSALHMSFFSSNRRDYYLRVARSEHNAALSMIASALSHVTTENCSAIYISAILAFIYSWAVPRQPGDFFLVSSSGTADWVSMFRGVRSIIETCHSELMKGPFSIMFSVGAARHDSGTKDFQASRAWLSTSEHAQLTHLLCVTTQAAPTQEIAETLRHSIESLEYCFCAVFAGSNLNPDGSSNGRDRTMPPVALMSDVYIWLYKMDEPFLELLNQRHPLVLVVFAHFCVLLNFLGSCWWMQGWSSHLLQEIWDLLGEEHRVWIRWPIEEIGWRPGA